MLHIKKILQLYDHNRNALSYALRQAGGEPDVILAEHEDFLHTLAMNNIKINPTYEGLTSEQATTAGIVGHR